RFAMSDDAYISMRIAHNLLHFNQGEVGIQAATSPLNLLLLLAIGSLFGFVAAAGVIFMIALPLMGIGIYSLAGKSPFAFFAAMAAALSPLVWVTAGLETVPLMALSIW